MGEVVFENVSFGYNGATMLKNVSFTARTGETIAIVGQTGSGKSTLTRLINRIFDADEGRVLVDGVDVRAWQLESLRSQISTIEQDVFLFSSHPGREHRLWLQRRDPGRDRDRRPGSSGARVHHQLSRTATRPRLASAA